MPNKLLGVHTRQPKILLPNSTCFCFLYCYSALDYYYVEKEMFMSALLFPVASVSGPLLSLGDVCSHLPPTPSLTLVTTSHSLSSVARWSPNSQDVSQCLPG